MTETLPAGYSYKSPSDGNIVVTLVAGQNSTDQNFVDLRITPSPTSAPTPGPTTAPTPLPSAVPTANPTALPTLQPTVAPTQSPTTAPTPVPLGSISGTVTDDLSKGNLSGVRITLIGTNGATIASTLTDSNGNYAFFDLPAGSYTVFEAPLTGFIYLTPVDGKIPVTLSGGQNVTGQNFVDRRLTSSPTSSPTPAPTADPTPLPTARPTPVPTANPTLSPTASPTSSPTQAPTPVPLSCISGNVGEDLFQGNVGPLAELRLRSSRRSRDSSLNLPSRTPKETTLSAIFRLQNTT